MRNSLQQSLPPRTSPEHSREQTVPLATVDVDREIAVTDLKQPNRKMQGSSRQAEGSLVQ